MKTIVLAMLLAVGCGGNEPPPRIGGGEQCSPDNAACGSSASCCSGLCLSAVCVPATSMVTWQFTDECNAGKIDYGFFDEAAGVAWPAGGVSTAYVAFFGQGYTETITCKTGDQICIGGVDDATESVVFGVGIKDAPTCAYGDACCFPCVAGSYSITLGNDCRLQ